MIVAFNTTTIAASQEEIYVVCNTMIWKNAALLRTPGDAPPMPWNSSQPASEASSEGQGHRKIIRRWSRILAGLA
jgi:hypothetical protein